jgi:hypothetical protein
MDTDEHRYDPQVISASEASRLDILNFDSATGEGIDRCSSVFICGSKSQKPNPDHPEPNREETGNRKLKTGNRK